MKKTLFATFFFPPEFGGIQTYLHGLISNLPPEKVVVLAKSGEETEEYDKKQPYPIYRTSFNSVLKFIKLSNLSFQKTLSRIIKKEHIEHVVLGHPLPLGISCQIIKKRFKIPYSTFTHGKEITEALKDNTLHSRTLRGTLYNADHVFCTTHFMAKLLIDKCNVPLKAIKIIPPGVSPETFTEKISKEALKAKYGLTGKKVLITISRLVKRKGHDLVLNALKIIVKSHPEVHYLIVGSGEEEKELKSLVIKVHLENHVTFIPHASNTDIKDLYTLSDIFVMPTRTISGDIEGFGIVYLEAAAAGLPVVATNTGGVAEAVVQNTTGILLDDPESIGENTFIGELTKTLELLLASKDKRDLLGMRAKKRVLAEFTWKKQSKKLEDVL
ncbi:glycosyltransferase family 4 protein [Patescibacteria group bacterium]|nr:glycosyltransferase family 4 protein [Patescibacteria group bacterium]